ncbi:type II toxin-antitoxin system prevent-host-death family antitoxin [Phytoactinopolyspora alkaliphila]|uniref:Type II toxin-antitoxin system prevent-host-death family antitoxin n=1 Tax=Phytoactinopolyspora alkaliphila TaxID=1783498 RepID=A0A6N9YPY5_9ACTN|nr:type II toxin-antitoxin system prevent-host-death family antitoxin [Phytoactinopolyspora alkaliphila]NED97042.1 type II toxin-antitoxin system prevent-host-death family antitoxin [Phytoactinopolyspora alkaliphila]
MSPVGIRELSHHTSRYLAKVKAGQSFEITERGRVIATLTPVASVDEPRRPRPKVGGYRSEEPLTAEEIDAELAQGFGDHDHR